MSYHEGVVTKSVDVVSLGVESGNVFCNCVVLVSVFNVVNDEFMSSIQFDGT